MKPYRKQKVASLIREIVSETILHGLHDPRVSAFTSVTRVEVSGDMTLAKVYLSVMGGEAEERKSLAGIQHARGHIQTQVASGLTMRQTPKLQFLIDESAKTARRIWQILDENKRENPDLYADLNAEEGGTDDESEVEGEVAEDEPETRPRPGAEQQEHGP